MLPARAPAMGGGDAMPIEEPPVVDVVQAGAARLELQFAAGFDARLRSEAREWVRAAASAVAGYFGRFPVEQLQVRLLPVAGAGVRGGMTFAEPVPNLRVRVGRASRRADFRADWVMVHEMIHLAIPNVPRAQNWLHEGIATYVEAVARARAGLRSAAGVWAEWRDAMPQGLPGEGDRGLDNTHTWARTYWGGALYCLVADVRIRERSQTRFGLPDALRGVLEAGGHYGQAWPVPRILRVADAAVGQHTLVELYESMKDRPVRVDLDALWSRLGVGEGNFSDDAPLAAVRRAIVS